MVYTHRKYVCYLKQLFHHPQQHNISPFFQFHNMRSNHRKQYQLGENPNTVHLVGGLGVDAIKELKLLSKEEIEQTLGIKFAKKSLLVTFHPATLEDQAPEEQISELLAALSDRRSELGECTNARSQD